MDNFNYRDGMLWCDEVSAESLAEEHGTPLYCYSQKTFIGHYNRLREAFTRIDPMICYSVKSCHNLSLLRLLAGLGSSFDVVSGGELARVREIGVDGSRIVYAGVGKTDDEIAAALDAEIAWFNVESEAELDNLATIANKMGKTARVALRVNPDVDPKTHVYTTTGKRETKFGVDLDRAAKVFAEFGQRDGIDLSGIHLHLGSPVNTIEPYVAAINRILKLIETLKSNGNTISALNLGGGFGAHYDGSEAPPASAYAEKIVPLLEGRGLQVLLEPGQIGRASCRERV